MLAQPRARPTGLSSANSAQTMPAPLRTPDQRLYMLFVLYCQLLSSVTCDLITLRARRQIPLPIPLPGPFRRLEFRCQRPRQIAVNNMIYRRYMTLMGRISGRSEAFLPAIRESWSALRKELIGEKTDRCRRPSRHGRHALP